MIDSDLKEYQNSPYWIDYLNITMMRPECQDLLSFLRSHKKELSKSYGLAYLFLQRLEKRYYELYLKDAPLF